MRLAYERLGEQLFEKYGRPERSIVSRRSIAYYEGSSMPSGRFAGLACTIAFQSADQARDKAQITGFQTIIFDCLALPFIVMI